MQDNIINDNVFIVKCQKLGRAQKYGIAFNFNSQLIEKIKSLPFEDRKFDDGTKLWTIKTFSLYNLMLMYRGSNKIRFEFIGNDNAKQIFKDSIDKILAEEQEKKLKIEELERNKKEWLEFKADLDVNYEKYSEVVHRNLKEGTKLYPHQIIGVIYANKIKKCLLALDMGTGKTFLAIALCEMNQFKKVFVIVPNSLKHNFYQEVQKITNSKAHIIGWKNNLYSIDQSTYIIVNYDFFNPSDKNRFNTKWSKLNINSIDALILDECQKFTNTATNIHHNIKSTFSEKIFKNNNEIALYMSGSPAKNKVSELYAILNRINSLDFPTKNHFLTYFCGMTYDYQNGYGWVVNDEETKYEELFHKISSYVYRKKLRECVQLPSEQYNKIILEFDEKNYNEYSEIEKGIIEDSLTIQNQMTIMIRLRQYLSNLKLKHVYELIDNILETSQKIVIFDVFKQSLYNIKEKYGSLCALHTGDQNTDERAELINDFQNPDGITKIFLTTFASGNYGLTLTEANIMFMLTIPYSLSEFRQSIARILRISQKNNVIIYPFIFRNSIDEYIYMKLEKKAYEIDTVMDGSVESKITDESVINDVIKDIKNKYKNNN